MTRVSDAAKKKYFERIAPFKRHISDLEDKEKRVEEILKNTEAGEPFKHLSQVEDNLVTISYYLGMNALSLSLLGLKNENALNGARKTSYRAIINLEKVFTNLVDVPFGEYEHALLAVSSLPELHRYNLIRKAGFATSSLRYSLGENHHWKWSIVEIEARLAVIAKNVLNLKTLYKGMDPRSEHYKTRVEFFNLVKTQLQYAADSYRLKYEVTTKRMDDLRVAIGYLACLQRLAIVLGRQNEAGALKRKIDIWIEKMEKDQEHLEKASRLKKLGDPGTS